jgi:hypothetical protein
MEYPQVELLAQGPMSSLIVFLLWNIGSVFVTFPFFYSQDALI